MSWRVFMRPLLHRGFGMVDILQELFVDSLKQRTSFE